MNLGMNCADQLSQYGMRTNTVAPNTVESSAEENVEPGNCKLTSLLGRGC